MLFVFVNVEVIDEVLDVICKFSWYGRIRWFMVCLWNVGKNRIEKVFEEMIIENYLKLVKMEKFLELK